MTEVTAGPGLLDLLRIVGALVLVIGLALAVSVLLRRGGFRAAGRAQLRVDERLTLGRGVQLAVVTCGTRRLLVGVSDKRVNLVTELDTELGNEHESEHESAAEEAATTDPPALTGFAARLATALARNGTLRRSA